MQKTALPRPLSLLLLLALVSAAGCAKINDASRRLLASSAPALAIVNGSLLSGKVMVFTDRTGTVALEGDGLSCSGHQRYTATRGGVFSLKCSDGNDVQLNFVALAETSGHARGRNARGPVSLTYGLSPSEAAAYLDIPPGQRMVSNEAGLRLVPAGVSATPNAAPLPNSSSAPNASNAPIGPATSPATLPVPNPSVTATPIPRN